MPKYLAFLVFFGANVVCAQNGLRHYALIGVTVIDDHHRQPLAGQTVVVRDGLIERMFADGTEAVPDSVMKVSMKGKYLVPGLIDSHVHLATDPSGVDNRQATLPVLERMLHSGITTVRDMAGDARVLAGLSRDALVGEIESPNIYYSALMAGPAFFSDPRTVVSTRGGVAGGMPYMRAVTDTTNFLLAVAEAKGTGAAGIKLYADLDAAVVGKIVSAAHAQGMPVWGHAWLNPARPSDLVKAGVGSISHSPLLLRERMDSVSSTWRARTAADRFWQDSLPSLSALFGLMKERHVVLDATLSAYHQWMEQDTRMQYYYGIAKAYTTAAYRAGVTICAGTDNDQTAFVQSEMSLLVHDAGLSPIDALVAATEHSAEAVGLSGSLGTVEKGKKADLLVVDKDPIADVENIRSVSMVAKDGGIAFSSPTAFDTSGVAVDKRFVKHVLTRDFLSEGVAIADVNRDGKPDILAGAYWFEAPNWTRHALAPAKHYSPTTEFSNSFLDYSFDVNLDGWPDLVRVSLPGEEAVWYENPGKKAGYWPMHALLSNCGNESPAFVDVDGDGRPDLLCNDPIAKEMIWMKPPVRAGDTTWTRHVIASGPSAQGVGRYTHGLGLIDMNGDGLRDVVITKGWWERPADATRANWTFHPMDFGEDCSQIYALDPRGDGRLGLVSSSAHRYGIWWHEQGKAGWEHHLIFSGVSETHALAMADVNGDGNPDLVTGKRYFAHNGEDLGAYEPSALYWFEFIAGPEPAWKAHLIDSDSGVGLQVLVRDLNGDGVPDIIVSNKKGVFFFEQVKR